MKSIIYLPSLGYSYFDISGYNYAERYMSSMDKMNPDKAKRYYLQKKELQFGLDGKFSAPFTSIFEYTSTKEDGVEVCKIYECFYVDSLTEKFKEKNILSKLVLILLILFAKTWILILAIVKGKFLNAKKRLEIFYFFTFLCLIAIFALFMFPAMLTSFLGALDQLFDDDSIFLDNVLRNMAPWVTFSYWVTTATAFLATIFPNFRSAISNIATEFLCIDSYLAMGNGKLDIIGKLECLIEEVSETDDCSSFEIHGYGFGSIIMMDTMFPFCREGTYRLKNEITGMVTIGCPHDFISTYYPNYFTNRTIPKKIALTHWFNIYAEPDILSSNFNLKKRQEDGLLGLMDDKIAISNLPFNAINRTKFGFLSHLGLAGLKAHQMFWGKNAESSNCLNLILNSRISEKTKVAELPKS